MADYLKAHGIEEGRILQESKSKTTQENIVNSKKLIAGDNASVGIITNDFHMFRALQIAHDNGLDEAQGIAARFTARYAGEQHGPRILRRNQIPAVLVPASSELGY